MCNLHDNVKLFPWREISGSFQSNFQDWLLLLDELLPNFYGLIEQRREELFFGNQVWLLFLPDRRIKQMTNIAVRRTGGEGWRLCGVGVWGWQRCGLQWCSAVCSEPHRSTLGLQPRSPPRQTLPVSGSLAGPAPRVNTPLVIALYLRTSSCCRSWGPPAGAGRSPRVWRVWRPGRSRGSLSWSLGVTHQSALAVLRCTEYWQCATRPESGAALVPVHSLVSACPALPLPPSRPTEFAMLAVGAALAGSTAQCTGPPAGRNLPPGHHGTGVAATPRSQQPAASRIVFVK